MVSVITDLRDLTVAECKAAMTSGGQLPQMTSSLGKGQLFNTEQRWHVALSGSAGGKVGGQLGGKVTQQQLRDQLGETVYRALCAEYGAKGGSAGTPEQKEQRQKALAAINALQSAASIARVKEAAGTLDGKDCSICGLFKAIKEFGMTKTRGKEYIRSCCRACHTESSKKSKEKRKAEKGGITLPHIPLYFADLHTRLLAHVTFNMCTAGVLGDITNVRVNSQKKINNFFGPK